MGGTERKSSSPSTSSSFKLEHLHNSQGKDLRGFLATAKTLSCPSFPIVEGNEISKLSCTQMPCNDHATLYQLFAEIGANNDSRTPAKPKVLRFQLEATCAKHIRSNRAILDATRNPGSAELCGHSCCSSYQLGGWWVSMRQKTRYGQHDGEQE
jgi:hypothetical protein